MQNYFGEITFKGKKVKWVSTFPKSLKFTCNKCTSCCCNNRVEVCSKELKNFHKKDLRKINDFYFLKLSPNGKCIFLNGENCKIYEKRPTVCSEYPFKPIIIRNTVYIDVLYTCPQVLLGRNSEEINLDNIVKKNLSQIGDSFEFNFNYSHLIKYWKKEVQDCKGDLFIYNTNDNWQDSMSKIINMIKKKKITFYGVDISKNSRFSLKINKDFVSYTSDNSLIVKPLNFLSKKDKTIEASSAIVSYLLKIWDRKSSQVDLFCFSKNNLIPEDKSFKESCIRITMLLELMAHLIALKNDHQIIEYADVIEAITSIDEYVFLPARMINAKKL